MEKKAKEQAIQDYLDMILQSWTWERLTQQERSTFIDGIMQWDLAGAIHGTYAQRWNTLQALYSLFLDGAGYTNIGWRE